jgi:hypothetical protein
MIPSTEGDVKPRRAGVASSARPSAPGCLSGAACQRGFTLTESIHLRARAATAAAGAQPPGCASSRRQRRDPAFPRQLDGALGRPVPSHGFVPGGEGRGWGESSAWLGRPPGAGDRLPVCGCPFPGACWGSAPALPCWVPRSSPPWRWPPTPRPTRSSSGLRSPTGPGSSARPSRPCSSAPSATVP